MFNFKTLTSVLMLISFLSASHVMAMKNEELKDIGRKYVAFLQKVLRSDPRVTPKEVDELFAHPCKKIVNGTTSLISSSNLPSHTTTAACEAAENIKIVQMITSPKDKTCTIRINYEGKKIGKHTTLRTLSLDNEGKIFQINEVFSESGDSQFSEGYSEYHE